MKDKIKVQISVEYAEDKYSIHHLDSDHTITVYTTRRRLLRTIDSMEKKLKDLYPLPEEPKTDDSN